MKTPLTQNQSTNSLSRRTLLQTLGGAAPAAQFNSPLHALATSLKTLTPPLEG